MGYQVRGRLVAHEVERRQKVIRVFRDNSGVSIGVSTDLPYDCGGEKKTEFVFSYDAIEPFFAELLSRNIRELIQGAIRAARRDAYEQGWKDAKSHKPKQDWFTSAL